MPTGVSPRLQEEGDGQWTGLLALRRAGTGVTGRTRAIKYTRVELHYYYHYFQYFLPLFTLLELYNVLGRL